MTTILAILAFVLLVPAAVITSVVVRVFPHLDRKDRTPVLLFLGLFWVFVGGCLWVAWGLT